MLSVLLLGIVRIASTAPMITYFLSEYVSSVLLPYMSKLPVTFTAEQLQKGNFRVIQRTYGVLKYKQREQITEPSLNLLLFSENPIFPSVVTGCRGCSRPGALWCYSPDKVFDDRQALPTASLHGPVCSYPRSDSFHLCIPFPPLLLFTKHFSH